MRFQVKNNTYQFFVDFISSHFMYSLLNHIQNNFLTSDAKTGIEVVGLYSKLTRYTASVAHKEMVSLTTEIAHTKNYLKAENIRFERTYAVAWPAEFPEFLVPSFVLQSLMEIAIRAIQALDRDDLSLEISSTCIRLKTKATIDLLPQRYAEKWLQIENRLVLLKSEAVYDSEVVWEKNGDICWTIFNSLNSQQHD